MKPKEMLLVLCFTLICIATDAVRIHDMMYTQIHGNNACYRRLNGTHQTGCTSKPEGSTGVIHFCESMQDIEFILKNGTAWPYIPVVPDKLLNRNLIALLKTTSKISGLLIYKSNQSMEDFWFSHDKKCPNDAFSVENTCKSDQMWNSQGTELLFDDIPFPIFNLEEPKEVETIKKCFEKFNNFSYGSQRDRSLCSIELKSFMNAATNTEVCIRRSNLVTSMNPPRYCDALANQNIWAALKPLEKHEKQKYIIISARLDTTSMFEKTSGASSPVTGIVTLLTLAKILKNHTKPDGPNLLFILFHGESYDYLGSQRLLYDMENSNFPFKTDNLTTDLPVIKRENIELMLDLGQLSEGQVFAHSINDNPKVLDFLSKSNFTSVKNSLPPSSIHTFARDDANFPGVVITNHEKGFVNHFYNSIYDDQENIKFKYINDSKADFSNTVQEHVVGVALGVAEAVLGEKIQENVTEHLKLVDELFYCYLISANCTPFQISQKGIWKNGPLSLYVGVDRTINPITKLTGLTLGWLTGNITGISDENCTNEAKTYAFKYYNMSKSLTDIDTQMCYRVVLNFTEALSPAFIIPDYDWSSKKYSTWAESTWSDLSIRLFLKPSAAHETFVITIGSISLLLSFIAVYFIKSKSEILFPKTYSPDAPVDC